MAEKKTAAKKPAAKKTEEKKPDKRLATSPSGLNVRSAPGGKILRVLPYNAEVEVRETTLDASGTEWARIGKGEYVMACYLEK